MTILESAAMFVVGRTLRAKAVAKEASYRWELSDVRRMRCDVLPAVGEGPSPQTVTARLTTNWCDPVFYVVQ